MASNSPKKSGPADVQVIEEPENKFTLRARPWNLPTEVPTDWDDEATPAPPKEAKKPGARKASRAK